MMNGQWDSAEPGMGFDYVSGQLAGVCVDATLMPTSQPARGAAPATGTLAAPADTAG